MKEQIKLDGYVAISHEDYAEYQELKSKDKVLQIEGLSIERVIQPCDINKMISVKVELDLFSQGDFNFLLNEAGNVDTSKLLTHILKKVLTPESTNIFLNK